MGPLRWGGGTTSFWEGRREPRGGPCRSIAAGAFSYRRTEATEDTEGDFGGGVLPPSRPGGGGKGRAGALALGFPLIPSYLDEGPAKGLILGGPGTPPREWEHLGAHVTSSLPWFPLSI